MRAIAGLVSTPSPPVLVDASAGRTVAGMTADLDFSGLRATFVNCILKRGPDPSHTQGLVDVSAAIMRKHGVKVSTIRLIDHAGTPSTGS